MKKIEKIDELTRFRFYCKHLPVEKVEHLDEEEFKTCIEYE